MDTEAPRLVAGGRHYAASVRVTSDHERTARVLRVIEHFAGGVEGIEIEMGNEHLYPL
jgi:hypothetical protein